MRKPLPPVASLSRVVEPPVTQRRAGRRPVSRPPADQVAMAEAMTRQSTSLRTSTMAPVDGRVPTKHWYRSEDPSTTAETDAAFAAFMAGDNPHLRTEEVPVVDFTSMIEKVGPDGRPVKSVSGIGPWMKLGLVALATTLILGAAAALGFIEVPGADRIVPGAQPAESVESPEVLSSTGNGADADAEQQPLSVTEGD